MILACPECAARFKIDPSALGPAGRSVRCARCKHVWRQMPLEAAPVPEVVVEAVPESSPVPAPAEAVAAPEPPSPENAAPDTPAPEVKAPETKAPPLVVPLPVAPPPSRRVDRKIVVGWASLAATVLVLIAIFGIFRETTVSAWPATARLYRAIGWPVMNPTYALQIRRVTPTSTMLDGKTVIVVGGEIVDTAGSSQPVPKLHLALLDKSSKPVKSLDFALDRASLNPGETTPFKIPVVDPPAGITEAQVSFIAP